jgi:Zn-dependent protease
VLVTSTRDVILYAQPGTAAPPRRRLLRALGGPLANLAAGCALLLAGGLMQASRATMAGLFNVCVGAWTLMPVPSLDGWVIWRALVRGRGGRSNGRPDAPARPGMGG